MKQGIYSPQIQGWMDKVMESRGADAETLLYYCDKIQAYGEQEKDEKLLGFAQYYRGENCYLLNDAEGMFRNMINAVENLKRAGVHDLEAGAYNLLGIVSANQGNAHFALDYYLTGLDICEKFGLGKTWAILEYNIGSLYFKYRDYSHARTYFANSRLWFKRESDAAENDVNTLYADISIASCYMEEGKLEHAEEYVAFSREDYRVRPDNLTNLYLWCFQARFCNRKGDSSGREHYIKKVTEAINERIPVLEVFEDLYIYCQMLLETEHYSEFRKTVDVMEQVTAQVDILHLRKNVLCLKLELYKKCRQRQAYLEAAAAFYELECRAEKENQYRINSIMAIRLSLEESRRRGHQMELENQILHQKSHMDALTGLANRFWLNEYAEVAFQNALERHYHLAIEILDIDYFKEYNDNYGHQRGDWCLTKISGVLQKLGCREKIFCARYGGDEFIIVYEGYSSKEVQKLAEMLKQEIADLEMEHEFSECEKRITISQGICVDIPKEDWKVWDYLHQADTMLYQVKQNNRNGIAVSDCRGADIQAQNCRNSIR